MTNYSLHLNMLKRCIIIRNIKKITYQEKSSAIFFNEKLFLIRHVIVGYNTKCVRVMNGDEYASFFVMRFSFKRDRNVDSKAVL